MILPLQSSHDLAQRLSTNATAADPLLATGLIAPDTLMVGTTHGMGDSRRETLFSLGLSDNSAWVTRMAQAVLNDPRGHATQHWKQHLTGKGLTSDPNITVPSLLFRAFEEGWWSTANTLLDSLPAFGLDLAEVLPSTERPIYLAKTVKHHLHDAQAPLHPFVQALDWLSRSGLVNGEHEWSCPFVQYQKIDNFTKRAEAITLMEWATAQGSTHHVNALWALGARPLDQQGHPLLWDWYAEWTFVQSPNGLSDQALSRRHQNLVHLTVQDPLRWENAWQTFPRKQYAPMWEAMSEENKAIAREALNRPQAERRLPLGWLLRATNTPMGAVLTQAMEEKALRDTLGAALFSPTSHARQRL